MEILVVQTAFLGDVVLTTPLLREIRRVHPHARLHVLATAAGAELLEGLEGIDRLWALDKRWNVAGLRSVAGLARGFGRAGFDVGVAAQRSIRTGLLLGLARARLRIGYRGAPGAWAYHRHVTWEPGWHAARRYLELAGPLGGDPGAADARPRLSTTARARRRVAALLRARGVRPEDALLGIAPGSHWPTKRWTPDGFAAVARAGARLGLRVIVVGTARERALCLRVAEAGPAGAIVLAGETAAADLPALLARARVVVGNDSGVGHVAAAVGCRVVTVFGPTAPRQGFAPTGPRCWTVEQERLSCRPCSRHGGRRCPRRHFRCMLDLDPERVIERLVAALADGAASDQPRPAAAR
jgi:heptosyltransferase-2